MNRYFLYIVFFIGLATYSTAQIPLNQDAYTDSIRNLLQHAKTDSVKARLYYELADYWSYSDTLKAKEYLSLSRQYNGSNPYLAALYHYYEASYYFDIDISKSESAYMQADSLLCQFPKKEAYFFRAKTWRNYGVLQQIKGSDTTFASILLQKAIPLAQKAGDKTLEGICYRDVGMVFMNVQQYKKASTYYLKSIGCLEKTATKYTALAECYILAARNYIFSEEYPSAKEMLDKANKILSPYALNESFPAYYLSEGMYYTKVHQLRKAEDSFNTGIAIATKLKDHYVVLELTFQQYKLLTEQKRYEKAKQLLLDVMSHEDAIMRESNRIIFYYELSQTYAKLGNNKMAYKWMKQYAALKDSVTNKQFKNQINELEVKYRSVENQKKIVALQVEKTEAALTASNNRLFNWLLGAACLCLLIGVWSIRFYYKNRQKLAAQKEVNYQQQLKEMEQQQQLTITKAMLEGEERERKRVARDLHDSLGGMLAGVKINLSGWAANHLEVPQDRELNRVINQLDNSVGELRRISRNMMPETLLKFGLEMALKDLCEFYMTDDLQIGFQALQVQDDIALPIQINIYRIVQELLSNAIKHAQATNILLQCSQSDKDFYITVEDNGIGFDHTTLAGKKGLGLANVKNRVEYLKGKMEVISSSGEGTSINIEINVEANG